MHTLQIYANCTKTIISTNENTFSLSFLDLGEVWIDQRYLTLPPLLIWILRPSWNVHFSQHVGHGFRPVRGLPHPPANTLHIHIFNNRIRYMSERYDWHSHMSDWTSEHVTYSTNIYLKKRTYDDTTLNLMWKTMFDRITIIVGILHQILQLMVGIYS